MYADIKSNNKLIINRLSDNERILLKNILDESKDTNKYIELKELTDENGMFGGISLEIKEVEQQEETQQEETQQEETQQEETVGEE